MSLIRTLKGRHGDMEVTRGSENPVERSRSFRPGSTLVPTSFATAPTNTSLTAVNSNTLQSKEDGSHNVSQPPNESLGVKQTIAYLTSVTACPPEKRRSFIDAAGVLKHSIHLVTSESRYDYKMYAFVHPNALDCQVDLEQIGYTVLVRNTPVQIEEIRNEKYRQRLMNPKAGCCQEKEFLKLYSYTMHDYPVVVHLDLDVMILRPMDDLFDLFYLPDEETKHIPDAMWPEDREWIGRLDAIFTRDVRINQSRPWFGR